jgi:hypothetical protein
LSFKPKKIRGTMPAKRARPIYRWKPDPVPAAGWRGVTFDKAGQALS